MTDLIESMSRRIADFLIKEGIESEDNREVIEYGSEVTIANMINWCIVFATGLIFGRLVCSLIFFISFALLRENSGGWHATKHFRCNIVLLLDMGLTLLLVRFLCGKADYIKVLLVAVSISIIIIILLFAPVENINKQLRSKNKTEIKMRCIIICIVEIISAIILMLKGKTVLCISIIMALVSVGISVVICAGDEKEDCLHKEQE